MYFRRSSSGNPNIPSFGYCGSNGGDHPDLLHLTRLCFDRIAQNVLQDGHLGDKTGLEIRRRSLLRIGATCLFFF